MMTSVTVTINEITYNAITDGVDTLINLCPHSVNFVLNGEDIQIPPSGQLARCRAITVRTGEVFMGIPVSRTVYGEVEGLPSARPHVGYIVSGLVKGRVPERLDVFAPSETIRNDAGQVAGAASLGV